MEAMNFELIGTVFCGVVGSAAAIMILWTIAEGVAKAIKRK